MQQALVTLHGAVAGLGLIVNQTETKGDKAAANDSMPCHLASCYVNRYPYLGLYSANGRPHRSPNNA